MRVLVTEPEDDLAIERAILGDHAVAAGVAADAASIAVAIVHQTPVDVPFLERYPGLVAVVRLGVGYDKVDLGACRARGVAVANVPDYCTAEVADTAMAMILDLVRGVREIEAALYGDPGRWQQCSLPRVRRTATLTLGVIGAGRIGTAVLERAVPFGFARIFHDPAVAASAGAERVPDLAALLARADVVTLHVPLDGGTRGMIDAGFIARMKPGASLVNTARGGLLGDESALLEALVSGRIAGAAFDVLPTEPPAGQPLIAAWQRNDPRIHGRLRINPHNAFYSREAAAEVRRMAAEEAARALAGQPLRNDVGGSTAMRP